MSALDLFFAVLWLVPLFVMAFLVWRHHRRKRQRCRRAYVVSSSPSLPLSASVKRGSALLEALLVIAFCAVIAAAITACLSDVDLITLNR